MNVGDVIKPFSSESYEGGYTMMMCLIPGTFVVIGQPSKTEYRFTDDQRTLPVKNIDVEDFLSKKRIYRTCCNSAGDDLSLFKVVDL
jgi:hypothetical protein